METATRGKRAPLRSRGVELTVVLKPERVGLVAAGPDAGAADAPDALEHAQGTNVGAEVLGLPAVDLELVEAAEEGGGLVRVEVGGDVEAQAQGEAADHLAQVGGGDGGAALVQAREGGQHAAVGGELVGGVEGLDGLVVGLAAGAQDLRVQLDGLGRGAGRRRGVALHGGSRGGGGGCAGGGGRLVVIILGHRQEVRVYFQTQLYRQAHQRW